MRAGGPRRIGGACSPVNLSGAGGKRMISWAQRWRHEAVRWAGAGADLLFPPRCQWCRSEDSPLRSGLCGRCIARLAEDRPRCPRCGTPGRVESADRCGQCRRARPACDGIMLLGSYADDLREAILRIKRPGSEHLAWSLAALLVEKQQPALEAIGVDGVVPVPMHWWRRAWRGTSDADEVARVLARAIGVGVVPALVRARATRMQNELPPEERGDNVAGAFRVRGDIVGRRLLLVDDVVTTGATLAACCHALREAGAASVHAAALAKADRMADAADHGERP